VADGLLAKLVIVPFEDSENVQMGPPAGPPFVVQFNPESFTVSNEIELGPDEPSHGDDGEEAKFKSVKPRTFTFEFLLDATGAAGEKREVIAQIELFKRTVGFSGKIHRPLYLVINWGTFIATCVLESFSVTYRLFRPNGTPLRATLSASFREHKPRQLKELLKNLSSPDIVHAHLVKEGEHLSLITHRVYKDPRYYYHVAEANRMNTVRVVQTGTTVYLPPLG
jgi:nucleoid-associated protein YgaU